jgi:dTDP-4-dehydrorhamnose 3,5-epimerase
VGIGRGAVATVSTSALQVVARPLPGSLLLQARPRHDERGLFARLFCRDELSRLGIERAVEQANLSSSDRRGTLRGLHYQVGPSAETKVVSCPRGALWDVVLDLRPSSPTYGRHFAAELSGDNHRIMVVPEGCAHGFLTLRDDTSAIYLVSAAYDPVRERGIRWNDPAFAIAWPFAPTVMSQRDASHPDYQPGTDLAA